MAEIQLGTTVDYNFTNANKGMTNVPALTDYTDYGSLNALRTFLAGFDAFTYTAAELNAMTINDMVFAVRSIQDATTISDYHPAQVARVA